MSFGCIINNEILIKQGLHRNAMNYYWIETDNNTKIRQEYNNNDMECKWQCRTIRRKL